MLLPGITRCDQSLSHLSRRPHVSSLRSRRRLPLRNSCPRAGTRSSRASSAWHRSLRNLLQPLCCRNFRPGHCLAAFVRVRVGISSFEQALQQDPACAIAYWGIALARGKPDVREHRTPAQLERGRAALASADSSMGSRVTQRERDYIAAVGELFRSPGSISRSPASPPMNAPCRRLRHAMRGY